MSGGRGHDGAVGPGEVVRVEEHDVVGVGLGPFNLGLAALLDPLPEIDAVFLEARPAFSWHPGLLLDGTTLQVPFLADLVTLADPTSPYSFLNYLHRHGRLYRFYFYERFHVPRREYDDYCRWVAEHLRSCRFGQRVVAVSPLPDGRWSVLTTTTPVAGDGGDGTAPGAEPGADAALVEHRAGAVVLGVGSTPVVPACARDRLGDTVLHSADYLPLRDRVRAAPRVTVIGSGQSAAEVFADLLAHGRAQGDDPAGSAGSRVATDAARPGGPDGADGADGACGPQRLDWFTRSRGFLPMEYSKLGLEHFTPEYTAYFHGLDEERRDTLRSGQDLLYKGISSETSELIYDTLYEASIGGREPNVGYRSACELRAIEPGAGGSGPAGPDDPDGADGADGAGGAGGRDRTHGEDGRNGDGRDAGPRWRLTLHHLDEGATFHHDTDVVVLATGYEPAPLPLAPELADLVVRDGRGRPVIDLDYRVRLADRERSTLFVQNAELHTHGVGAPDLGLGAHRSAVLVNALAGREVYPVRTRTVFQSFGAPPRPGRRPAPDPGATTPPATQPPAPARGGTT